MQSSPCIVSRWQARACQLMKDSMLDDSMLRPERYFDALAGMVGNTPLLASLPGGLASSATGKARGIQSNR